MKTRLTTLLCSVAIFGIATSAYSLTIVPTFDPSITNDPNSAAIMAAINSSIQTFQSNIIDVQTVKILFVSDTNVALGQSATWQNPYAYPDYLAALKSRSASVNDTNALSKLPNSTNDPVVGNSQINLKLPLARLLGLDSGYGPDGYDSTITCNMSLMNFTRPPTNSDDYDLISTLEHEIDEVLGFSSNLKRGSPGGPIGPMDLFRYDTNLNRTFTTNGDNAYFSVDGTNLWARFNMDPGGDYHDWWSVNDTNRWAPPGVTPHNQVQDAFGGPGSVENLGTNELTGLDVIGWTLAVDSNAVPASPTLKIVSSGAGQITLSWSNTVSGLVLQERTNLISGNWINSVSGSTNPVLVSTIGPQKFYRVYQPSLPLATQPGMAQVQLLRTTSLELGVHVMQRRRF